MTKKIITESSDMEFNEETGKYELKSQHQVAVLSTEEKYFKFYYEGLMYISDMPAEYHRVFYALLDNMTYVDQRVEGLGKYGMHIFINKEVKVGIAQVLGMENYRSLDNIICNLVKGNVLMRIGKGILRPNPYIVARGSWKEIAHLRMEFGHSFAKGDTFKRVCAQKDAARKQRNAVAEEQAKHQSAQEAATE